MVLARDRHVPAGKVLVLNLERLQTHGLIQVFEEEESLDLTVRRIIEQGTRDPGDRVLLYLVLALGRVLSGPESEATVADIDAEAYFQSAEFIMADNGTKDLWTIRVLLLKCLYALSVVRRNEGYEYIGQCADPHSPSFPDLNPRFSVRPPRGRSCHADTTMQGGLAGWRSCLECIEKSIC